MSKQYEDSELQKDPPCSMPENNEEDLASEASENQKPEGVTRRKFVALAGTLLAATTLGTSGIMAFARENSIDVTFPVSGGYLIVDSMRCCGCQNCMMMRNDPLWGNESWPCANSDRGRFIPAFPL